MKSLEEFVQLFAEQFDDTDPEVINPETQYHDLDEWSSLITLSLIAVVDDEFGVALTGDDIQQAVTVKDLYDIIISSL